MTDSILPASIIGQLQQAAILSLSGEHAARNPRPTQIVVIDNGSQDGTVEMLGTTPPRRLRPRVDSY